MTPLETARAAKRALADRAITHRCPTCADEVTTYVPAELYHRCPKRPASKRDLTRFREVVA